MIFIEPVAVSEIAAAATPIKSVVL